MGQFFNFLLQNPVLIWIGLAFGAPVIRSVIKRLREQSDKRQQEIARERALIEALRTGRVDQIQAAQQDIARQPQVESPSQQPTIRSQPYPNATTAPSPKSAREALEEIALQRQARGGGQVQLPPDLSRRLPEQSRPVGQPPTPARNQGIRGQRAQQAQRYQPTTTTPTTKPTRTQARAQARTPTRTPTPQPKQTPKLTPPSLANDPRQRPKTHALPDRQPIARRDPNPVRTGDAPEMPYRPIDVVYDAGEEKAFRLTPTYSSPEAKEAARKKSIADATFNVQDLRKLPRKALKQAYLMQEVFGKPLGMRNS